MFVLTLLADTIRIPPQLLAQPTMTSVQTEIEKRYPNKIIMDIGLVVCPYGPPLEIGDGVLVPGDGGAHHQVLFQCVVFRPFAEEVLLGVVKESHEDGVAVSVGGFFDHVFIPAYWMLNPSKYDQSTGLWVWTPKYDEDEGEDGGEGVAATAKVAVKQEGGSEAQSEDAGEEGEGGENQFEIEIGSEIRFKVKAVNFTRITTTMKGVQATTTSTATVSHAGSATTNTSSRGSGGGTRDNGNKDGIEDNSSGRVRVRSLSAELGDSVSHPAPMQIVGSICEDGLGLTSWWNGGEEEDEEDEEHGDDYTTDGGEE